MRASQWPVASSPGRSAAHRSNSAIRGRSASASRSSDGAVTRTAVTWLVAWVCDLTAESRTSSRTRIISTRSSPCLGVPAALTCILVLPISSLAGGVGPPTVGRAGPTATRSARATLLRSLPPTPGPAACRRGTQHRQRKRSAPTTSVP